MVATLTAGNEGEADEDETDTGKDDTDDDDTDTDDVTDKVGELLSRPSEVVVGRWRETVTVREVLGLVLLTASEGMPQDCSDSDVLCSRSLEGRKHSEVGTVEGDIVRGVL